MKCSSSNSVQLKFIDDTAFFSNIHAIRTESFSQYLLDASHSFIIFPLSFSIYCICDLSDFYLIQSNKKFNLNNFMYICNVLLI
jgi:hypothetical protein